MRHYPRNSPQAAARILALLAIADGHVSRPEIQALDRLRVPEQLGLDGPGWHDVLTVLCQDLLLTMDLTWADVCQIDERTLRQIFDDVDDPVLRWRILQIGTALVEADGDVTESEGRLLATAVDHWGLQHDFIDLAPA